MKMAPSLALELSPKGLRLEINLPDYQGKGKADVHVRRNCISLCTQLLLVVFPFVAVGYILFPLHSLLHLGTVVPWYVFWVMMVRKTFVVSVSLVILHSS